MNFKQEQKIQQEPFNSINYENFELSEKNRPIDKKLLNDLIKSFKKNYFGKDNTLLVIIKNNKLLLKNGHHSFLAAKFS